MGVAIPSWLTRVEIDLRVKTILILNARDIIIASFCQPLTSLGWGDTIRVVKDFCRRTEDLTVGAVYCKDCLRYKLEGSRCENFVEGNFVITGSYVTKNGVTKWKWEPKRTVPTGAS